MISCANEGGVNCDISTSNASDGMCRTVNYALTERTPIRVQCRHGTIGNVGPYVLSCSVAEELAILSGCGVWRVMDGRAFTGSQGGIAVTGN